ncbi:hypothetical protein PRZ48_009954 [Zasmidium cellare]|uniref:Metalloendopeptidase n=1 Tax=Zasmidium cellare TaxID=395010 RepID=A0ABR0EE67_ZASCE|nr:hypothetical protein PRZ48_009954 [Zasmidium cellare]
MQPLAVFSSLLLIGALRGTTACPEPNNDSLSARWYSVGNPTGDEPKTNNAWPVTEEGVQPVRYCWVKQSDKASLQAILNAAIEKWSYAMQNSALQIIPDQTNGPNICGGNGVRDDALQIEDISDSDSGAMTTQGYWGMEGQMDPGRHTMKFFVEYPGRNPHPNDVVTMAHELGHAIGLEHEHARPDAAESIWFYCENLYDYDDVKARIQPPDTIDAACKSRSIARKYGFSAWAYLPSEDHGMIGQNAWSKKFDRDSIMIYGSYDGGKKLPPTDNSYGKPVLLGHSPGDKDPNAGQRYKIYMGGSPNKAAAGISEGDTARVAQLYPPKNADDADMAGANDAEWQGTSKAVARRGVKTAMPR